MLYGAGIMGVGVPAQISALSGDRARTTRAPPPASSTRATRSAGRSASPSSPASPPRPSTSSLADGASPDGALADGYERGLLLTAVLGLAILVLAAASRQLKPSAEELAELAVAA